MGNKPLTKLRPDELNEFRQLQAFSDAEICTLKKQSDKLKKIISFVILL